MKNKIKKRFKLQQIFRIVGSYGDNNYINLAEVKVGEVCHLDINVNAFQKVGITTYFKRIAK